MIIQPRRFLSDTDIDISSRKNTLIASLRRVRGLRFEQLAPVPSAPRNALRRGKQRIFVAKSVVETWLVEASSPLRSRIDVA